MKSSGIINILLTIYEGYTRRLDYVEIFFNLANDAANICIFTFIKEIR